MGTKFSVIIPSYNRSASLGRTIKSVIHQTFQTMEIIVVDDGSTDDTRHILEAYPEVIYHYQENSGVSAARNKGAEIAKGDWLIFLDSDDELSPKSLEEFSIAIGNSPDSKIFLSGFKKVNSRTLKSEDFPARFQSYSPPLSGTFVLRRSLFLSCGKYDVDLGYAENMELFLRLSKQDKYPKILESMSLIYHESISGGSKNLSKMDESLSRILAKHSSAMEKKDIWNLHQTLGVIQLRREKFVEARKNLLKAVQKCPSRLSTYSRLMIACLPFLSRQIYKSDSFTS